MVKRLAKSSTTQNGGSPKKIEKFEAFQDETGDLAHSALESFFMQGKSAAERMNTGRMRRRDEIDENHDESAAPAEKSINLDCDLAKLRDFIQSKNESLKSERFLDDLDEKCMSKWTLYLAAGFNLLIHGIGSKRDVLTRFANSELSKFTWMRIDATHEESTPKIMLAEINTNLKLGITGKGLSTVDWARQISRQISKSDQQLILLIDNIEAADWRNEQEAICALLHNPKSVKLCATVDHVYSTFVWNSRQLSTLKFLHLTVNTFEMPLQELINGNSRILGLDAKFKQSCHTVTSLDVFWKSLAANSQKLFILFFRTYYPAKKAVNFWDLFNSARDDFIVSTDAALRTQIVEFKDHRVIRWSRGDDGSDQLSAMVDQTLITKFLETKGIRLFVDEEEENQ
ncbi:unnamed protein product [Caenorhabditis angaria]|uniref:Origin recognition complex subunit 2 n=1 Tax=Caenorhabditis angaria TaxID=860376 RepID=A0A9P1MX57_9PELO|nr:unnamed protein product [Caenorhabditis angaria]